MLSVLSELEPLIRERLPPERYGFKYQLMGSIFRRSYGYSIRLKRDDPKNYGWECSESALTIQDLLKEKLGVNGHICGGIDEYGLFKFHLYVFAKEPFNVILDGVPIYRFIDALHQVGIIIPREVLVENISKPRRLREGLPISLLIRKESMYCTNLQMLEEKPKILYKMLLATYRVVNYEPIDVVETTVFLYPKKFDKKKISPIQKNVNPEEIKERFQELKKMGMGDFCVIGGNISFIGPQNKIPLDDSIVGKTKEIHEQDYDVLSNVAEQILFS